MRTLNFSDEQTQQPANNPIGNFSKSIIEMLNQAKAGELDTTRQKSNLQQEMYGSILDSDYLTNPKLTPQAQERLAVSEAAEYEPGINVLDAKLGQLRDTMDLLKKTYDKDWTKIMPVSEQTGKIIKAAFRQGKNLTTEELNLYKDFITEDDVMAWANSKKSEDKPTATETKDAKNQALYEEFISEIEQPQMSKLPYSVPIKGQSTGKWDDQEWITRRTEWIKRGGDPLYFNRYFEQYKPKSASSLDSLFNMSTYNTEQ